MSMRLVYLRGIAFLFLFAAFAFTLRAEDIVLTDGTTYRQGTVVSESGAKVHIRHAGGLASVDKTLLPPKLAAAYPVNPIAVDAAKRREADALEAQKREAAKSEALRKLTAERVAAQEAHDRLQEKLYREGRAKAMDVGSRLIDQQIREQRGSRYDSASNFSVNIEEVQMVDAATGRWNFRGTVVKHVRRDIMREGNSEERALYMADDKTKSARELRQMRAQMSGDMSPSNTETYGFDAQLEDLNSEQPRLSLQLH